MKKIFLVGSSDALPYPLVSVTRKQLLSAYNNSIVYNPLLTLMLAEVWDTLVVLSDSMLGIGWHILPDSAVISDVDNHHPMPADMESMAAERMLVMDAKGPVAQRTENLSLGMERLETTGFCFSDWERELLKRVCRYCGRGGARA